MKRPLFAKKLLDAVVHPSRHTATSQRRRLRHFPLAPSQITILNPTSPSTFFQTLLEHIQAAERRILLATLYIGPGANQAEPCERRLLQALREKVREQTDGSKKQFSVQILMDHHRALRPVRTEHGTKKTLSAAEACWKALQPLGSSQAASSSSVHLLSVVPSYLQQLHLASQLCEVAGVFHGKVYICDDTVILSGANLSESYFTDRLDRAVVIRNKELTECYANVLKVLTEGIGVEYQGNDDESQPRPYVDQKVLAEKLTYLLTTTEKTPANTEDTTAAVYAVPTVHLPSFWLRQSLEAVDTAFLEEPSAHGRLLTAATAAKVEPQAQLRMASAYLNPQVQLLDTMTSANWHIHFLTAGLISHGFAGPSNILSNPKYWVPYGYQYVARQILHRMPNAHLSLFARSDLTFHAKGLWLYDQDFCLAAVVGSSNYGMRSELRDLEMGCVLVLNDNNDKSNLQREFTVEWEALTEYAVDAAEEEVHDSHPGTILTRWMPYIRTFL